MGEVTDVDGSIGELRRSLAGDVLGPDDAGYDAARQCFNALVDRRPARSPVASARATSGRRSTSPAPTSSRSPCAAEGTIPPGTASSTAGS